VILLRKSDRIVPETKENSKKCLCPECPVYNDCIKNKDELLFCSKGATDCKIEKWGCRCFKCPIQSDYQLVGLFYCEKGAVGR